MLAATLFKCVLPNVLSLICDFVAYSNLVGRNKTCLLKGSIIKKDVCTFLCTYPLCFVLLFLKTDIKTNELHLHYFCIFLIREFFESFVQNTNVQCSNSLLELIKLVFVDCCILMPLSVHQLTLSPFWHPSPHLWFILVKYKFEMKNRRYKPVLPIIILYQRGF